MHYRLFSKILLVLTLSIFGLQVLLFRNKINLKIGSKFLYKFLRITAASSIAIPAPWSLLKINENAYRCDSMQKQ